MGRRFSALEIPILKKPGGGVNLGNIYKSTVTKVTSWTFLPFLELGFIYFERRMVLYPEYYTRSLTVLFSRLFSFKSSP